ncbi:MAG: hypothetical protein J0H72_01290 [Burkholderiales bacterium]|nr:hypothetical protein [Burkholderiales bacterium]
MSYYSETERPPFKRFLRVLVAFLAVCFLNAAILRLACHAGGLPESRLLSSLAVGCL